MTAGGDAEPALPRALIRRAYVATPVGLAMVWVNRAASLGGGPAVGLAVLAIYVTATLDPPGGLKAPAL